MVVIVALCALATSLLVTTEAFGVGFPMVGRMPIGIGLPVGGLHLGGHMGMKGGFGHGFGHGGYGHGGYGQGGFGQDGYGPNHVPEILTCIAKDQQDPLSQVRLTVSGNRRGGGGFGGGGFGGGGFGGFGGDDDFFDDDFDDDFFDDDEQMGEYRVDGTFIPSMSLNKAGTYQVVVTTYGRTADGCSADALGPIYQGRSTMGGGMGGMGGYGRGGFHGGMGGGFGAGMGGFGMPMGHPFMGGYGGGFGYQGPYGNQYNGGGGFWNQNQSPTGKLPNPAIVGGSATIYSAHIQGVSKNDLLGRGIALCRNINNGRCDGYIPFCCTIQRDSLPAMELFVNSASQDDNDGFNFPLGGVSLGGNTLNAGIATTGDGNIGNAIAGSGLF